MRLFKTFGLLAALVLSSFAIAQADDPSCCKAGAKCCKPGASCCKK